ncbi:MAG: hypothetical protein JOZ07_13575 [Solirubrobacterales bacterium]|nr:hypothetical protein [Solirubrobacterales bacterium]
MSDDTPKPSEQRGGTTPGERESAEKGPWAQKAAEGVVPAHLGGSDAPAELQDEDRQLDSSVLGSTTGSDEPATAEGIAAEAGERADATRDGAPPDAVLPDDETEHEPDLRDAGLGPRQSDLDSAG